MTDIFIKISQYMGYPFVRYALIACILVALCSSLLGVILVLKRYSFIGGGLSHVAFGAMAIATVLNFATDMVVILPITIISAIILLRTERKIKGDAAIAMLSVSALAIGYLVMNVFSASPNVSGDVCSTLFGSTSILTLSKLDVWTCVIMSAVVLFVFIFLYNRIFAVTFDENFAAATGVKTSYCNSMIAVIIAVIIVLAMKLVGSLLTSALIIFPALSSMRVFKSFKSVIISSAILAVFSSAFGIILSILASFPVGATVVAVDLVIFIMFSIVGNTNSR